MDKERFEVQTAANTVEIAVSRFKMLQIARIMDRTVNPKKITKRKKKNQTIPDPKFWMVLKLDLSLGSG